MKDSFSYDWKNVDKLDIDQTANLILTARTAKEAKPSDWILTLLMEKEIPNLKVLDFGCGFGRNTFGLANYDPTWSIVGYDNDNVLAKTDEYQRLHYGKEFFNIEFTSNWDDLKQRQFDVIIAILVFQHIHETPLKRYIEDFKKMSKKWIVHGRRLNDDPKNRSTWKIIEECGVIPTKFYNGSTLIPFASEGDPHDHHLAIYEFN